MWWQHDSSKLHPLSWDAAQAHLSLRGFQYLQLNTTSLWRTPGFGCSSTVQFVDTHFRVFFCLFVFLLLKVDTEWNLMKKTQTTILAWKQQAALMVPFFFSSRNWYLNHIVANRHRQHVCSWLLGYAGGASNKCIMMLVKVLQYVLPVILKMPIKKIIGYILSLSVESTHTKKIRKQCV